MEISNKITKTNSKEACIIKYNFQDKNVSRDNIGDKRGKVYVDTQNFDNLPLKKRKIQK